MQMLLLATALAIGGAYAPADDEPTYTLIVKVGGV